MRIESGIRGANDVGRAAFIPYLTAGYPSLRASFDLATELAEIADVIELGIPFSDPVADGPTIQRSSQKALEEGCTASDVLELLARLRSRSKTPVVLFSYLNPILRRGVGEFAQAASEAGADGILVTDLPLGSDRQTEGTLLDGPLDLVRLVAPTTPLNRAREIAESSQGFVYYVARAGVTGARRRVRAELAGEIRSVIAVSHLPVAAGFGIATPDQARIAAQAADGVVVGSALVDAIATKGVGESLALAARIRDALDREEKPVSNNEIPPEGAGCGRARPD